MKKSRSRKSKQDIGEQIMILFLSLRSQIKVFHWQSETYAMHKSLDKLNEDIVEKTDLFMESYIGLHGRFKTRKVETTISILHPPTKKVVMKYLTTKRNAIDKLKKKLKHSEYVNIMEEILAALDQGLYLLSLT